MNDNGSLGDSLENGSAWWHIIYWRGTEKLILYPLARSEQ